MEAPYYILVSHSNLSNNATTSGVGTSSTSLGHSIIQYHYADDSPLSLLPKTPDEHVLILDYDSFSTCTGMAAVPTIKSISSNLAITGVKVSEAPGAAAAHDELQIKRNDEMYILETCTTMEDRYVKAVFSRKRPTSDRLIYGHAEEAWKRRRQTCRMLRLHLAGSSRGSLDGPNFQ
jgi:hypothetical protein